MSTMGAASFRNLTGKLKDCLSFKQAVAQEELPPPSLIYRDCAEPVWPPSAGKWLPSSKLQFGGNCHNKILDEDVSEQSFNLQLNRQPLGPETWRRLLEQGFDPLTQCRSDKPTAVLGVEDKSCADVDPAADVESGTPEGSRRSYTPLNTRELVADGVAMRNETKIQATIVKVKSWACVNFSEMGVEPLLKFSRSLGRMCIKSGMDFSLEPAMVVNMSSPCPRDILHGVFSVHEFFDQHEMENDEPKFLLVILPDTRFSYGRVEELSEEIKVLCHCCLPLSEEVMLQKKYLKNVTDEIKAKVIESDNLSKYCKTKRDWMEDEYYNSDEEMVEDDGNNCEEMVEDEGYEYAKLEASELCTCPNKAKSASITWACVNFSHISGKETLKFLSNLIRECASIGMDISLEPTMLIHIDSSSENDLTTGLCPVFEFFDHLGVENPKTLVVVILPDLKYFHGDVKCVLADLGLVYQLCLTRHARKSSQEYLKNVANEMNTKVLQCNTISDSCEDLYEDDPEEIYYQQSDDSDVEMSDNVRKFSEKLAALSSRS